MSTVTVDHVSVDLLETRVVDDVSLHIDSGAWLTLVGPNGAGKTTALRAISAGVEYSGQVLLDDVPLAGQRAREIARTVAVVPQQPTRPPGMTVLDYVLLGRTPYVPYFGVETTADLTIIEELLDTLDLRSFAGRQVTTLSGGEFQRAALARALAQQAPVLLLDEPTSALDLGHAQHVLELVDELRRDRDLTVIAALHDLTTAGQFSDTIAMLVGGKVVAAGDVREVLTEELITTHYGARVRIIDDPEAGLMVVPMRAAPVPGSPAAAAEAREAM